MTLKLTLTTPGNLPCIKLYHGVERYNFLVDTGSTDCWLMPECIYCFMRDGETKTSARVDNMNTQVVFSATLRAEPLTGTEQDNLKPKFRAEFLCKPLENFTEMNKYLDDKIHGILGMSFLRENNARVDIKHLVMQL